jgi:hypothetical protein
MRFWAQEMKSNCSLFAFLKTFEEVEISSFLLPVAEKTQYYNVRY